MKPKQSPLKLQRFLILKSCLETVVVEEMDDSEIDFEAEEGKIPFVPAMDLDFDILDNPLNSDEFAIKLNIRTKKAKYNLPGYKFEISVIGEFYLQERKNLKPERHTQYVLYSALPMVISFARSEIADQTAKGIFGAYYLPAISLPDLVEQWFNKQKVQKQK